MDAIFGLKSQQMLYLGSNLDRQALIDCCGKNLVSSVLFQVTKIVQNFLNLDFIS